ncbi:SDR family oxidoreductase [Aureimonas phyllosphaerae]|uniref:NAD(P)-dependent dehydrogenase (Short-subunit alcohol dehydrogenase family) n=1 Tax=Aureimonas phyllosphaerae TaxID=1166078 RepID=A0A7W6FWF4_9HYPH|nr:SDR family oxidoreductase [Aureimonas phyllosphaerae]MBB3938131.1 NAD(P)-dependent dehydrogenase (short-subunit alcohol dehydrogenase family) [Aureimonas phyllosphaerae]MBB3962136.1 NAD(P)-dependent dehydrogenase (short-subunit alcohol dehydrogenase family) [Aureimonas phyllosphaerae]
MAEPKVWFITGAGRGIGSDVVTAALMAGHFVVATACDAAAVTDEVGEHDRLLALAMDVTDQAAVDGAVRLAVDRFGRIDVLVNNAGRFHTGFFETLSPEQVRAQMEVNFFGTLNVTRAILPVMRAQRRGHVVTVSALLGIIGAPFVSMFSASKFALEGWMESIASELEPFGIATTIVEPGAFRTKPLKDRGRTVFPDFAIEDYAEATERHTASVKAFNGHEPGHRQKLASAFVTVVDMEPPPKRWVAGQDAVDGIIAKGSSARRRRYRVCQAIDWPRA